MLNKTYKIALFKSLWKNNCLKALLLISIVIIVFLCVKYIHPNKQYKYKLVHINKKSWA